MPPPKRNIMCMGRYRAILLADSKDWTHFAACHCASCRLKGISDVLADALIVNSTRALSQTVKPWEFPKNCIKLQFSWGWLENDEENSKSPTSDSQRTSEGWPTHKNVAWSKAQRAHGPDVVAGEAGAHFRFLPQPQFSRDSRPKGIFFTKITLPLAPRHAAWCHMKHLETLWKKSHCGKGISQHSGTSLWKVDVRCFHCHVWVDILQGPRETLKEDFRNVGTGWYQLAHWNSPKQGLSIRILIESSANPQLLPIQMFCKLITPISLGEIPICSHMFHRFCDPILGPGSLVL